MNPIKIPSNSSDYGGGIDTLLKLKDISPTRPTEPIILPRESIVEVLRNQTSLYKERIVTSTYIGRNSKQVNLYDILLILFKQVAMIMN